MQLSPILYPAQKYPTKNTMTLTQLQDMNKVRTKGLLSECAVRAYRHEIFNIPPTRTFYTYGQGRMGRSFVLAFLMLWHFTSMLDGICVL